ncbi:MAG: DUF5678 domain-containing protein [Pseudomonadota bacterium]|nr:DUF5678 domain-containing protein [Pseudomonadota bacterium]
MPDNLNKDYSFYEKNRKALLNDYEGRYIVIYKERVVGAYDTQLDAIEAARKKFPLGKFLVQLVTEEDEVIVFNLVRSPYAQSLPVSQQKHHQAVGG